MLSVPQVSAVMFESPVSTHVESFSSTYICPADSELLAALEISDEPLIVPVNTESPERYTFTTESASTTILPVIVWSMA